MSQALGLPNSRCPCAASTSPAAQPAQPSWQLPQSRLRHRLRGRSAWQLVAQAPSRQTCQAQRLSAATCSASGVHQPQTSSSGLWTPDAGPLPDPAALIAPAVHNSIVASAGAGAAVGYGAGYDEHKAKTPPPDLPSLMLDSRIVYLGMPLVSAVTELIIAELLYLQYKDRTKPMNMYINSTGTTRADGESVGFETEGTAIFDTMSYVNNEIHTVGVGVAFGQSCMLLSAGTKGKRFMLPHATAMLHQPRVPPTGQRQAVEIQIKWREVLAQKNNFLNILSRTTGHSPEKLDKDMQRPLYMRPLDAIDYGVIDRLVPPQKELEIIDQVKAPEAYDKEAGLVARPASQF